MELWGMWGIHCFGVDLSRLVLVFRLDLQNHLRGLAWTTQRIKRGLEFLFWGDCVWGVDTD